jgi:serine protease Do
MAHKSSMLKMGTLLVIAAACPIGWAAATGTIGIDASSARDWVAWIGAAGSPKPETRDFSAGQSGSLHAGSLANAVDIAKLAVIGVRAKHPAEAGEQSAGLPSDRFADPFGAPHGKSPPGRRASRVSLGSGFFISADGYAVTNNHVTEGSDTAEIMTDDQKTYTAKVVGADPTSDLALLKVDGRNDFAYAKFVDKAPRVGDRIFAIGNPLGLAGTVTAGIVSARERSIGSSDRSTGSNVYENLIQIDAAINRGNSGGPSFDMEGNVIGVNTVIFSPTGGSIGIGFAVPAETVKTVIAQLMEKGSVTRGWLGVQFQPLTPAIADVLGLKEARGALVAEPFADGPAQKAGIAAGDVITAVNGEAVKDNRDLSKKMIGLAPGMSIDLGIVHDGEEKAVSVTLGELPATQQTLAASRARAALPAAAPPATSDLGLKLAPAATMAGAENPGVIVIGIDPNGRAADLGVEAGDIILEVSGKPVRMPEDIRNALNDARGAGRHAALMRLKSGERTRFIAVPMDPA